MDVIREPDVTTGAPVSPEQAADLAALRAHIAPDESATAPQEPAALDYATEASAMVDMFAALVTGYEPKTLPIWDEPRKAGVSAALAPVLEKYAFTLGNIPPEFYLLVVIGPPLYQSSKIIAEGMNAKPAAPARVIAQAGQAPGSNAVSTATHSPEMMGLEL